MKFMDKCHEKLEKIFSAFLVKLRIQLIFTKFKTIKFYNNPNLPIKLRSMKILTGNFFLPQLILNFIEP